MNFRQLLNGTEIGEDKFQEIVAAWRENAPDASEQDVIDLLNASEPAVAKKNIDLVDGPVGDILKVLSKTKSASAV
jgi:hypothetical protein